MLHNRSKFIAGSFLLLSGTLLAQDPCCPRVATCCPELIEECCFCDVCPPSCEITPKAGPCVKEGIGVYVTADFTYWSAQEDNLEFAMTSPPASLPAVSSLTSRKSRVYQIDSHWRPGFKVGLGKDLCFDGWDVYAEYTWFNSTTTRKTSTSLSDQLQLNDSYWIINNPQLDLQIPVNIISPLAVFTLPGSFAKAKWHLAFNVVDLEFGRNFYISRRVMFRPYLGLKGTWQTQKMNVSFQGVSTTLASDTLISTFNRMRNWGVGILTGMNGAWHVTRNFSVIGNLAFSALWEQFKVRRLDNQVFFESGFEASVLNVSHKFHRVRPVIEWMLGLRWEDWFNCDTYHYAFDAGWEIQNWFSQNQFIRVPGSASSPNGDLMLQGLTIRGRIDF